MAAKRYMNVEGKIINSGGGPGAWICSGVKCEDCLNNNPYMPCIRIKENDPTFWHKNLGYREIFELENYTDKNYVMICSNDEQSEVFAKFLDKNGKKWRDGHTYTTYQCWRSNNNSGTCFIFNLGMQCDLDWCASDYQKLYFENYVFKTGEKTMKKDLRKLIKPGYMLEDMEGTRYLATEYLDAFGVTQIGLVEGDKSFDHLYIYDADLRYKGASVTDYDIVKIWGLSKTPGFIDDIFTFVDEQHRDVIWERDPVKEMTVAEIEKELGYSIKVVK